MTCWSLPSARPIACNDCPAFQRPHISARWAEDSFHRLCIVNTTLRKKIYIRWCCIDRLSRHDLSRVEAQSFTQTGVEITITECIFERCECWLTCAMAG